MSKPKNRKNRRKKTPLQLNRDRKRAESFRAKKVTETDVILPFSGKLLPVKEGATLAEALVDEHGDISDVLGVSTTPEINSTLPSIPAAPLKNSLNLKQLTPDVSTARKELFSTSSPSSMQMQMQVELKEHKPSQSVCFFNMKRRNRGCCLNFLMYFSLKGGYS